MIRGGSAGDAGEAARLRAALQRLKLQMVSTSQAAEEEQERLERQYSAQLKSVTSQVQVLRDQLAASHTAHQQVLARKEDVIAAALAQAQVRVCCPGYDTCGSASF